MVFLPISQFFTICEIVKVRENRLCCVVIVMHAQKIKLCCVVKLCFFTITTSQFHKFTILFYNSVYDQDFWPDFNNFRHRNGPFLLFESNFTLFNIEKNSVLSLKNENFSILHSEDLIVFTKNFFWGKVH